MITLTEIPQPMKVISLSFLCIAIGVSANGQNLSVTFTGTGATTQIDSITATNLRTSQSVTLAGDGTLILGINTVVTNIAGSEGTSLLFPNPFEGKAWFSAFVDFPQTIYLKVLN